MSSVPKYLKHSSGQARVVINGTTKYLGKHGSKASKQRYDALIAEYLASGRSPAFGIPEARLTMADLMLAYLKHCRQYYPTGNNSETEQTKAVLRIVSQHYSDHSAAEFGPLQLKAVRAKIVDTGNWSRVYINRQMRRFTRMFKWAASEGMLPASVNDNLRSVSGLKAGRSKAREVEPVRSVDSKLVDTTLLHLTKVLADMVRFQQLTGCRPGEVCRITPSMVDRSGDVWKVRLADHKTAYRGKERTIYVGPKAQVVLAPYLLRASDSHCFSPVESEKQRRAAVHAQRKTKASCGNTPGYSERTRQARKPRKQPGECWTTGSYAQAIRFACDRAHPCDKKASDSQKAAWRKKHRWSPNQLRHAAATDIRKKFGLDAAQVILGHSELGVTQVYAEQDHDKAVEVARLIG
jgi:integrase